MKRIASFPTQVLVVALCCVLVAGGCTASQITAYINLAAQLAVSALQIASAVGGAQLNQNDLQIVAAWQALLEKSVIDFQSNKSAGYSTLGSIAQATENNLASFLTA